MGLNSLDGIGRWLIFTGIVLVVLGLVIVLFSRLGFFRLPGDIVIARRNFVLYIPIVSSIVLSLILTVILNLIFRRR
ncbi:MAG: DUF2905 domain-containing protein [candidate division WOR-3 bacterium]|jgi:uncharacterized membrane protein